MSMCQSPGKLYRDQVGFAMTASLQHTQLCNTAQGTAPSLRVQSFPLNRPGQPREMHHTPYLFVPPSSMSFKWMSLSTLFLSLFQVERQVLPPLSACRILPLRQKKTYETCRPSLRRDSNTTRSESFTIVGNGEEFTCIWLWYCCKLLPCL